LGSPAVRLSEYVPSKTNWLSGFPKEDPIIFISTAGSGVFDIVLDEPSVFAAFTSTGSQVGLVCFSEFVSSTGDLAIDAFMIREVHDHILVSGIFVSEAAPEPASLSLLAFGGLALIRRRRSPGPLKTKNLAHANQRSKRSVL